MTEFQQLQGTWQAVTMEAGGRPLHAEAAVRLKYVYKGDRVILLVGDKATGVGIMTVRPDSTPKAIDVAKTDAAGHGQVAIGTFAIAGDRLTKSIGLERPEAFTVTG
jgi:uncharacterized protein (TIGR03067 family)